MICLKFSPATFCRQHEIGSMPNQTNTVKNEAVLLYTLAGIQFTHIMDFMIVFPLGPMFRRVLNISANEFGLMVSVYSFAAAISGLLAATFIDRYDRKRVVLTLYILFAAATLLCALAPNFWFLMIARGLAGVFGGILGAMVQAFVGDCIPEQRRGRAMGVVMGAFSLSTIAGVPLGLWLANHFSWRAPFIFVAGLSVIIFALGIRALPKVPPHAKSRDNKHIFVPMLAVLREPNHLRAFGFMCLMIMSSFSVIPFITLYMTSNVKVEETLLPYIYLVGGFATFFSSRGIGWAADKYGKIRTYRWVALVAMLPLLLITHLQPVAFAWVVVVTTLFFVFISGRMIPGMAVVTSSALPHLRGTFMSMNSSAMQMASGLASLVAGLVIGHTESGELTRYDWVGYAAMAVGFAAMWMIGRVKIHSASPMKS
jgi:multidrug resistance protein